MNSINIQTRVILGGVVLLALVALAAWFTTKKQSLSALILYLCRPWKPRGSIMWIERASAPALVLELEDNQVIRPFTMFKAIRMRTEQFGLEADYRIQALAALAQLFPLVA